MQDIEAIRRRLPLRYPYLMVDRVVEEGDGRVVAVKNVTVNEPFFQGHFPEPLMAVMPGTLIVEAMAQTAALLASQPTGPADERGREGYLVGIEKARFRRRVVPGDQLRLEAMTVRTKRELLQAEVRATVDGETVATAIVSLLLGPSGP